jgi:hypothetical protein
LRDHRRRRVAFVVAGEGPWSVGGLVHGRHASKVYGGSLLWGEDGREGRAEAIGLLLAQSDQARKSRFMNSVEARVIY